MEPADLPEEWFEVEHQVRAGAMGAVFRARDRSSGEPVAIKVIGNDRDVRGTRFARAYAHPVSRTSSWPSMRAQKNCPARTSRAIAW